MKKYIWIFAAAAALCLCAGCGKNGGGTDADTTAQTSGNSGSDGETAQTSSAEESSELGIDLGDYKGLEVTVQKIPDITDEDVELQLQNIVSANGTETLNKDRSIIAGDLVSMNYQGYDNGTPIGEEEKNYYITIGSGIFFDGAEMSLVGAKGGDVVEIPVTLPESYPDQSLAGKDVIYRVTVNGIVEKSAGELTDEYIAQISDCDTVDEYRAQLKSEMQENIEFQRTMSVRNAVWDKMLSQIDPEDYPEDEKEERIAYYKNFDQEAADEAGVTLEEYVESNFYISFEDYEKEIEDLVMQELGTEMVVRAIAEKEGLSTEDITDDEIKDYAKEIGYDDVELLYKDFGEDEIRMSILREKVTDILVDNAKVTEVDALPSDSEQMID